MGCALVFVAVKFGVLQYCFCCNREMFVFSSPYIILQKALRIILSTQNKCKEEAKYCSRLKYKILMASMKNI